jgi:hypothetical protein
MRRALVAAPAARAETPFLMLMALALLSPLAVLAQGGGLVLALLSFPAVLAVPCGAVEAMLALARAVLWVEGGGR